jgi:serine phosphatase RsbU (regulator of sigma subunit)
VHEPLPVISYVDVVRNFEEVSPVLKDKIVFVGLVEDPWRDFVSVPRLQTQGQGVDVFGLHGVVVLAAITETLLRGAPIRDAGAPATLAWVIFWCVLTVSVLPRRHPTRAAMTVAGVIVAAIIVTGVLHVKASIVFPAGLVFGAVFLCGTQALISSYVETTKALHVEEIENERTRQEMLMARRTQETFLPSEIPVVEGVGVWGINVSSLTVSGDYYDVVDLGEGNPLVVVIADVSGKGLPASLIMSNVQAGLHSHMLQERFDLKRAAENLNRLVHSNTEAGKFVTLFVAEFDKSTRELRYVRAGHDEPLLASADGTVRRIEDGGFVLGFMPDIEYDVGDVSLVEGDVLCLYTDGVTEARSPEGEEFGIDRLTETVRDNRLEAASGIGAAILKAVGDFTQIEQQADDVTLVILKVGESST